MSDMFVMRIEVMSDMRIKVEFDSNKTSLSDLHQMTLLVTILIGKARCNRNRAEMSIRSSLVRTLGLPLTPT